MPRSSTRRAAAHRMRSRLRRASARSRSGSGAVASGSVTDGGSTYLTLCRDHLRGARPGGQQADEPLEGVARAGVGQMAVVAERDVRLTDGQL